MCWGVEGAVGEAGKGGRGWGPGGGAGKMFKNTFQSGFLSILYSIGSKPLQIWDKKGKRCPLLHACEGACGARRGVGARGAGPGGGDAQA
eukprot:COSAG02_NODE_24733_length_679_cov_0.968966_1_plen_89_part_10